MCVGGMRMSTIATSGRVSSTLRCSSAAVPTLPTTSKPASVSSRVEALAEQHLVVCDHDSHGISARIVTMPSGAADERRRRLRPRRLDPRPALPAPPLLDLDDQAASRPCGADGEQGRPAAANGVRRRARRRPPRPARSSRSSSARRSPPASATPRRATRSRRPVLPPRAPRGRSRGRPPDLGERGAELRVGLVDARHELRVVAASEAASRSSSESRDEPLLRAVMKVALEPSALRVAGRQHACTRRTEVLELRSHSAWSRSWSSASRPRARPRPRARGRRAARACGTVARPRYRRARATWPTAQE